MCAADSTCEREALLMRSVVALTASGINRELTHLAGEIRAHRAAAVEDFDSREALYMRREDLRLELRWLEPAAA